MKFESILSLQKQDRNEKKWFFVHLNISVNVFYGDR